MSIPNIVIFGHVCIDHNTIDGKSYTTWGSSSLYVAQYYQTAQKIQPTIFADYGPDFLPYARQFSLQPSKPMRKQTLRFENEIVADSRTWRCYNDEFSLPHSLTTNDIQALKAADIVIFASLLANYPPSYVAEVLSYVPEHALRAFIPQGYFREILGDGRIQPKVFADAEELLPLFDLTVCSTDDYPDMLTVAYEWSNTVRLALIVTQGSAGATVFTANKKVHIPTTPVPPEQIVNPVGCGDVFTAALAYSFYETNDLERAVTSAHRAAADKLRTIPL